MLPLRREFAAKNHFSFSDPIRRMSDDPDLSNGVEFGARTERIKGNYDYFGRSSDLKFGAWTRRTPGDYEDYINPDGDEFKWLAKEVEDDSDVASPQLWKKAGSPVNQSTDTYHHHNDNNHLYPTSRADVIARYRQEMLEMVKDMPESAYELSLRDIVELPSMVNRQQETLGESREFSEEKLGRDKGQKKKKKGTGRISRSTSMDTGGLLIKMFYPTSLGAKRKIPMIPMTYSKVSPKPTLTNGEKGGVEKVSDGELCKEFAEMSSSSSTNSNSSSSSSGSSTSRKMSSCYPFFHTHRGKATED